MSDRQTDRLAAVLGDIQDNSNFIRATLTGLDLDGYKSSQVVRYAVERAFGIIGEAMTQVRDLAPEVYQQISGSPQIVGLRNLLIHHYWRINARLTVPRRRLKARSQRPSIGFLPPTSHLCLLLPQRRNKAHALVGGQANIGNVVAAIAGYGSGLSTGYKQASST